MTFLTMDPISARTLPALDEAVLDKNADFLTQAVSTTTGEALRRLTLAAISRHDARPRTPMEDDPADEVLIELIKHNHRVDGSDPLHERLAQFDANSLLDQLGDRGEQFVLFASLMRYYWEVTSQDGAESAKG